MLPEFVIAVEDEARRAADDANESHKFSMNSYGAGYDAGYRDGLRKALVIYREVDATV